MGEHESSPQISEGSRDVKPGGGEYERVPSSQHYCPSAKSIPKAIQAIIFASVLPGCTLQEVAVLTPYRGTPAPLQT